MAKNTGNRLLISYFVGFVLSVILASLAFGLVIQHELSSHNLYIAVSVVALVLLLVQALFFLRLNASTSYDKWNLVAFVFTIFIILLVVTGSLWIMYNLNYNMVSH